MSRLSGVALGVLALTAAAAADGQAPNDVASNWAAIAACGALSSAPARHSCVDDVMRRAGVLTDAVIARNAREEFGKQPEVAKPARVERAAQAAPAKAPAERIDQLVTTIRSVTTVGYKKLRVTTADGSVWDQTQAAELIEPAPGDGFAVEKASMGSYLCRLGRSKSYRCQRVD